MLSGKVAAHYVNLDNETVQLIFPDDVFVNGRPLDRTHYPLFAGPFIQSEAGSGVIDMNHQNEHLRLDFRPLLFTD